MRTNGERIRLIHKRTAELKRKVKREKEYALNAVCVAACLLLVIAIGGFMPELMSGVTEGGAIHASGAASLIGSHDALGYILMGLLAFLLGVCVTVLLYRLRRRNERREDGENEL